MHAAATQVVDRTMNRRKVPVSLDFRAMKGMLRLLVCGASQDRLPQAAGVQRALARVSTAARVVSGSPLGKDSSNLQLKLHRAFDWNSIAPCGSRQGILCTANFA